MWAFIADTILPLIGTFLVGAAGWFITHFLAGPILRFYRLRDRIWEELVFTANVRNSTHDESRYNKAADDLRRLAAELDAIRLSAPWPVRTFLSYRKYDLGGAFQGLIGFANTLADRKGERAANRFDIEKALKFPMTYDKRPVPRD